MAVKELKKNDFLNILVFVFFIGCILGNYYEQLLTLVKGILSSGQIIWVSRSGLLYGPFSPVYGFGAVLIVLLFCHRERPKIKTFLYGALFGGTYEYLASVFQERVFGTMSWDYSHELLNIGGRTTIPFTVFWGILVLVFVHYLFPYIKKMYFEIKPNVANAVFTGLLLFFVLNITLTVCATGRQSLRYRGIEAQTFIGEFCDKHYTDEYLADIYENSKFVIEK